MIQDIQPPSICRIIEGDRLYLAWDMPDGVSILLSLDGTLPPSMGRIGHINNSEVLPYLRTLAIGDPT